MTWLELMDERGSGIRRMREVMQRHGLEVPRFALVDDEFTVTLAAQPKLVEAHHGVAAELLPGEPYSPDPELTENQNAALTGAAERGCISTAWCVQHLGLSRDTAWRMLDDLKEKGFLEKIGTGRATRYVLKNRPPDLEAQERQAQIRRKSDRNQAQIGRNRAKNRASHDRAHLPTTA